MDHHGYEYEETDDAVPRRLRAHTPAVEDTFSWLTTDEVDAAE